MRAAIVGSGVALVLVFCFIISSTVLVNHVIKDEQINALNSAMYQTEMALAEEDDISSNDEFYQAFLQYLRTYKNSDAKWRVQVYAIDYTRGLLRVKVTATWENMRGTEVKYALERTILSEGRTEATLEGIEITTPPNKTEYSSEFGNKEIVRYQGIEVNAIFSNGTKRNVTENCTFDPAEGTELEYGNYTKTVTVTYKGKTVTFDITHTWDGEKA